MEAEESLRPGRVGPLPIVESSAGIDRRYVERAAGLTAMNHHHERRVGLVEVREVVERGQLEEGAEVVHQGPAAKRDDHAFADAGRQRIAASRELARGNL